MLNPRKPCTRCKGTGRRPLFGRVSLECRRCDGDGDVLKLSWRLWYRLAGKRRAARA